MHVVLKIISQNAGEVKVCKKFIVVLYRILNSMSIVWAIKMLVASNVAREYHLQDHDMHEMYIGVVRYMTFVYNLLA